MGLFDKLKQANERIQGLDDWGQVREGVQSGGGRFLSGLGGAIGGAFAGARDRAGDAFAGARDYMSQAPQQRFGTSALQQAMMQQRSGNMTPQAEAMMNYYQNQDPAEMNKQAQMMEQGLKGADPRVQGEASAENVTQLDLDRLMEGSGSLNEEGIKRLQGLLNEKGFTDSQGNPLAVDGKMGKLTRSAMGKYGQSVAGYGDPAGEPLDSVTSYFTNDAVTGKRVPTGKPRSGSDPFGIVNSEVAEIQNTIGNPDNNPAPVYNQNLFDGRYGVMDGTMSPEDFE
tara:strand:- start:4489 stop:5340 length:852 start_codon:yes stop_codon:yes gene_type:complete